jgi:hypothetical protein
LEAIGHLVFYRVDWARRKGVGHNF